MMLVQRKPWSVPYFHFLLDAIYNYGVKDHMNARKLFYHKATRGDVIVEMVITVTMALRKRIILSSPLKDWLKISAVTVSDWRTGSGDHETY